MWNTAESASTHYNRTVTDKKLLLDFSDESPTPWWGRPSLSFENLERLERLRNQQGAVAPEARLKELLIQYTKPA